MELIDDFYYYERKQSKKSPSETKIVSLILKKIFFPEYLLTSQTMKTTWENLCEIVSDFSVLINKFPTS